MARKSSSSAVQEELYPTAVDAPEHEALDDARLVDLDVEKESPFLRGQKRVSARRAPLPKRALSKLKFVAIGLTLLGIVGVACAAVYRYSERSWRFRIESSDDIEIDGTHNVTHAQVMEVLGGDIGRNIFFIPLSERRAQLEKIPWVESASVMRFVPNRLKVEIHERTPVAFARIGPRILLTDAGGTLMELPGGKHKYSFPVIVGMNSGEPPSTREARMKIYNDLVRQLDSEGGHYSQDLSEVDLSDPEDVKVLANDPNGAVLVHLGSGDYLSRYHTYVTHVQGWRQQFEKLDSVDLRYDNQIIVNPDNPGGSKAAQLSPAATKAAIAAGVKPAALIHVINPKPSPPSAKTTVAKSAPVKPLTVKPAGPVLATPPATPAAAKPATVHHATPHAKTAKKPVKKASAASASKTKATKSGTAHAKAPANGTGTTNPATSATASSGAPAAAGSKSKPSPAIAKNQDEKSGASTVSGQQDHP
jgi:cell division protein FtsQ